MMSVSSSFSMIMVSTRFVSESGMIRMMLPARAMAAETVI